MRGQPIDEAALRQSVERQGLDWCYYQRTGSTNADVLEYYASHQREVVAFSEGQSAGRGRRDRQWLSPHATNIYCTVGIAREIPANCQGLLSIVTGLALCRALRDTVDTSVSLKWPNDLLHDGRKLGGILIESRPLDQGRFFFAIGFGINVFMNADELAEIGQPVTSLDHVAVGPVDRSEVLESVIDSVVQSIRLFEPAEVQALITEFAQHDAFHDCRVEVISGEKQISGINRGITADGQLQLETEAGIEVYSAAEISLRAVTE
jgi:BirA family biotin operon repressor/biotin-[acetyl-CoA-carboxylase] ligase